MTPEVDGTARAIALREELRREQHRLGQALAAGRMCAIDYDVARDHLVCSSDAGPSEAGVLGALNGTLSDLLDRINAEDRPQVESAIRTALDHGDELEFEARLAPAMHRTQWLLVRAAVERDYQGRAIRLVGVARDNTARKEGQVVRHVQGHGERLRALGQMASGIAHDLNQSLAVITGYSDMVRQELALGAPDLVRVREMVEITAQAALDGGHALRGLLSFVRSQELMAETEHIDALELLHEIARLTAPHWRDASQVEGRPINLTVTGGPDLSVTGSAAALREALTNLIFNAVDALPHGGEIHLRGYRQQRRVLVEVHDSGTGIAQEVLPRIFDPFFTTKGERGTGLGLPQVRNIVERHGGTIDVESSNEGTTFRISLPASAEDGAPTGAEVSEPAAPAPRRSIRVLVVEDEQQLADMASLVLKQRGHQVIAARSAEEAVTSLENEAPFDLVISDLGLGAGKNGWELADAVRHGWPDTRFILVTGWGAAISPAEARIRGVHGVIAKPYRISELRQVADDVAADVAKQ